MSKVITYNTQYEKMCNSVADLAVETGPIDLEDIYHGQTWLQATNLQTEPVLAKRYHHGITIWNLYQFNLKINGLTWSNGIFINHKYGIDDLNT